MMGSQLAESIDSLKPLEQSWQAVSVLIAQFSTMVAGVEQVLAFSQSPGSHCEQERLSS